MTVAKEPTPESAIRDAVDALLKAETIIADFDRSGVMKKLDELREAVEALPQVQLDMRISRLRLQAFLSSDPDATPTHGISTATLKAARKPLG
jgi:uncharacterized protein HemX